ncbi:protein tweety homolog 2 [Protopterus annectens]|uniref:protein tweety homolog 2 n=1 Tax=Protopterus annectens TaxID=7888 RepID=UPI001CFB3E06|nr:protein tweety homolog 2 [Protopterus annectens]
MSGARVDYIAPWWTYWLHNFPHINLSFQTVDNTFSPKDNNYLQSLIFLAIIAAICLGFNLLFLLVYLTCLCCCKKGEAEETKKSPSSCFVWIAVFAGLVCCTAVGIGFYGNSETNDGVYQLTYSLNNVNHMLKEIDSQVSTTTSNMQVGLKEHLARLDELFARQVQYIKTLTFVQQMASNILQQLSGLPNWQNIIKNLAEVTDQISRIEYYRWLSYLLLLILDLIICLVAFLGLAKHKRWLLTIMICLGLLSLALSWASLGVDTAAGVGTSDFCVAPTTFITNLTSIDVSSAVVHYYLYCSQGMVNPFQQALTTFQRSLTTMQIQIQGLLTFAVPLIPAAKKELLGIQQLLNQSETSLHQLTALMDCRGLHKDYLDALIGVCYDGVEGLLYLALFSLLTAAAFTTMVSSISHVWKNFALGDRNYDDIDEEDPFNPQARRIAAHNPNRGQMHSFCSYSSSLGSQTSLHPPAQAVSNAPVSEYMNQAMLFGGNPRYENVPLIGRGSPPPTYSPGMRATYLTMTDEQQRQYRNEVQ